MTPFSVCAISFFWMVCGAGLFSIGLHCGRNNISPIGAAHNAMRAILPGRESEPEPKRQQPRVGIPERA